MSGGGGLRVEYAVDGVRWLGVAGYVLQVVIKEKCVMQMVRRGRQGCVPVEMCCRR